MDRKKVLINDEMRITKAHMSFQEWLLTTTNQAAKTSLYSLLVAG
jgi:hypothetical protein